jgi:hypothetical protein
VLSRLTSVTLSLADRHRGVAESLIVEAAEFQLSSLNKEGGREGPLRYVGATSKAEHNHCEVFHSIGKRVRRYNVSIKGVLTLP